MPLPTEIGITPPGPTAAATEGVTSAGTGWPSVAWRGRKRAVASFVTR